MVAHFLAQRGWDVVVASNGDTALLIARERRPQLVYLDVNLPRLSGYDVCEQIRSDPHLHDLPVLMTSARSSIDVRAFSLEAGANAYLAKPYELEHLAAVAERLVMSRSPSSG